MRTVLVLGIVAAAAALSGCVGYGGGVYGDGYYGSGYYGYSQPYVYGSTYYNSGRNYDRRDRDGDGVPNWRDARPDNPRRY
jgi:hypothetical protein